MLLIDRYIIRQFLINFVILLVVLLGLFVLIDLVVDLDEFLDAAGRVVVRHELESSRGSRAPVSDAMVDAAMDDGRDIPFGQLLAAAIVVVWDWHGPLSVLVYVYLSGLVVVGAMGFTFADLSRKREVAAIVMSGVSMYRLALPILIVGSGLNLLALPLQEWVIPPLADKLARSHRQMGRQSMHNFEVQMTPDGEHNLLSAAVFDPQQQLLTDVCLLDRDAAGRLIRVITAEQAHWNEDRQGYDLTAGYERHPVTADLAAERGFDDDAAIDAVFFETSLSPKVLVARRAEIYPSLMSIAELQKLRRGLAAGAAPVGQMIHRRFSMLVVNMLVLVMGLVFFLNREPVNMLVQAVRAASVCLGAWSSSLVILQIGGAGLNPAAAAWLPVVVYMPVGAWLFQRIKT